MYEISETQAEHRAEQRRRARGGPVGVAVRRAWFGDDAACAVLVLTDGQNTVAPAQTVYAARVRSDIDLDTVEDVIEDVVAERYAQETVLRDVERDLQHDPIVFNATLEQIWLDGKAL